MSNFALRLPDDLKEEAAALAEASGMSLNQFINNSIAGKVAVQKEAARFFDKRAARATGGKKQLKDLLAKSGQSTPPRPDDV